MRPSDGIEKMELQSKCWLKSRFRVDMCGCVGGVSVTLTRLETRLIRCRGLFGDC